MNRLHGSRRWGVVAILALLPSLALAEVSAQLDARGNFKRVNYLVRKKGAVNVIWAQVRPWVPQYVLLNPVGDNLGDLPPVIEISPITGNPWVVWPKNFGNLKQLVFATWDVHGRRWTDALPITPGTPLVYDDLGPSLAFDSAGTPYLVWWTAGQTAKIFFSTLISGVWTPPLLVSDQSVDSRLPSITLRGTTAVITYVTPAGMDTKSFETGLLINSAASLMDNPIPPLNAPPSSPGGGPAGGGDGFLKKK